MMRDARASRTAATTDAEATCASLDETKSGARVLIGRCGNDLREFSAPSRGPEPREVALEIHHTGLECVRAQARHPGTP